MMLTITTTDYIISINLSYLIREIDLREDEDATLRTAKELYDWAIDNIYRSEMEEELVVSYKTRITGTHPEEQFFEKPKDLDISY